MAIGRCGLSKSWVPIAAIGPTRQLQLLRIGFGTVGLSDSAKQLQGDFVMGLGSEVNMVSL